MAKRMVHEKHEINHLIDGKSISRVIEELNNLLETVGDVQLGVDVVEHHDYGSHYHSAEVTYYVSRPETREEEAKRLQHEELRLADRRRVYEALKEEFEGE